MSKIVCNKADNCRFRKEELARGFECGGAVPHTEDGCEPCPVDSTARCVPVKVFSPGNERNQTISRNRS